MSLPTGTLGKPSSSVREIETVDGSVLLDIRQGLCLSMTPISTKVWGLLKLDRPVEQIIDTLSIDFPEVERKQIHRDVTEFVADLAQKGLLLASQPSKQDRLVAVLRFFSELRGRSIGLPVSSGNTTIPRFLTLKAVMALLAFDLFGFGNNFPRVHGVITVWPRAPRLVTEDAIERICKAIDYACMCYPKRVLCLQRSFVTTCLARGCGLSAEMVFGAQKLPFKAHAWTEIDGQPINERKDVRSIYALWDRC